MPGIVSTIEIARPPAEVFAYVTDPARFPQWQRDVVSVRMLPDGRFTTTRRVGGVERAMTQAVTRHEPPSRWAVRGVDGPIRPHADLTVEPVAGGTGSRVTFSLDFEGHGLGVALVPFVRRQAARGAPVSYRNLKRLLEAGR